MTVSKSNFAGDMHAGNYFVFAFPDTFYQRMECEFTITALTADATVHVTAAVVDLDRTDQIPQGTSKLYTFKCDDIKVNQSVEGKSIIINSDEDVQVEAYAGRSYGDSFLVLPVQPNTTEYMTGVYFDPQYGGDALVVAVATEPDTIVNVHR